MNSTIVSHRKKYGKCNGNTVASDAFVISGS